MANIKPLNDEEEYFLSGLSLKQEKFCLLVAREKNVRNATRAYREAGYKVNTDAAAWANASRLLGNAKVKAFIKYLREKSINQTIADLVEVKQGLTEILRGRISQYIEMDENGRAAVKPDAASLGSAAVAEITTESVNIGGQKNPLTADITKFKLRDPVPAARLLAELSGWTEPGGINLNFDQRRETKVVVIDSKQTAQTIIEAIRLGIGPEVFGEAGDSEDAAVLPAPPHSKAVTLPGA